MFAYPTGTRRLVMMMLSMFTLFVCLTAMTACAREGGAEPESAVERAPGSSEQAGQGERGEGVEQTEQTEQEMESLRLLNASARQMHEYMRLGDVAEARIKLIAISDQLTRVALGGVTSIEGINELTRLLVEAKGIFNTTQLHGQEALVITSQIHLAIDALSHNKEPMWRQHGRNIQSELERLQQSWQDDAAGPAQEHMSKLQQQIDMIRPALVVSQPPEVVNKLDSLLRHLGNVVRSGNTEIETSSASLTELQRTLGELFGWSDNAFAYVALTGSGVNRLIVHSTWIGLTIVLALAYVAWRRFGHQQTVR